MSYDHKEFCWYLQNDAWTLTKVKSSPEAIVQSGLSCAKARLSVESPEGSDEPEESVLLGEVVHEYLEPRGNLLLM